MFRTSAVKICTKNQLEKSALWLNWLFSVRTSELEERNTLVQQRKLHVRGTWEHLMRFAYSQSRSIALSIRQMDSVWEWCCHLKAGLCSTLFHCWDEVRVRARSDGVATNSKCRSQNHNQMELINKTGLFVCGRELQMLLFCSAALSETPVCKGHQPT